MTLYVKRMSWYKIAPEVTFESYKKCVKPIYQCLSKPVPKHDTDPFVNSVVCAVTNIKHMEVYVQAHKMITMKMGDFHESIAGSIDGYRKLPIGNPSGCDIEKEDLTEVFELKNRANTMNSSSASSVIDKLIKAHNEGKKAHLVLINCEGSVPRFKAPDYIEVWNGRKFYTHITGSETFFDRLEETLRYTMENFKTFEEIEPPQSP